MNILHPLGPGDLEIAKSWVESYYHHDGLEFGLRVEGGIEELLSHPEYGQMFEVREEGCSVGYTTLTYGFDHEIGGRLGVITDLFLIESARGRGLGTRVMDELASFAKDRGLNSIELVVLDHNPRGRAFYERLGFEGYEDRTTMLRYV